jgi:putative hydrolase of the HAD superfamily
VTLRARALVFDLDNTLVPELPNYNAAFAAACAGLAREHRIELDVLRDAVFESARVRWLGSGVAEWCLRLGIGSPTSLLSDFPGAAPELALLRTWAPEYRRAAWRDGLLTAGGGDADRLAVALSDAFRQKFRERCPPYVDAPSAVEALASRYAMAIATNGPSDVQRIKLSVSGLRRHFAVVVASSDIGAGKPDPRIFRETVERLGVPIAEVIAIGDHLEKDVAGARAAGLRCVWVNRAGAEGDPGLRPDLEIRTLAELPAVLA